MADATIEFYDPTNGVLQASALMAGMACRRSGSGTTVARQGGNTVASTILIDISGCTYPVVAVVTNGYNSAMYARYNNQLNFATSGAVGSAYEYFIFDYTDALPEHTAEIQIRDPNSGKIRFSNRYWPMLLRTDIYMDEDQPDTSVTAGGSKLAHAETIVGGHSRCPSPVCYINGQPSRDDEGGDLSRCNDIRGRINGKIYGGGTFDGGSRLTTSKVSVDDVVGSFGRYQDFMANYNNGNGWMVPNNVMIVDVTNIPVGSTFF